jgi:hypothetical protein
MRPRRQHRNERLPSGLAEVELFTFWEADLAGDVPVEPVPVPPSEVPSTSSGPLWWAMAVLALLLPILLVLLLA